MSATDDFRELSSFASIPEVKTGTEKMISAHQSGNKHVAETEGTTLSIVSSETNLELPSSKVSSDKRSDQPPVSKTSDDLLSFTSPIRNTPSPSSYYADVTDSNVYDAVETTDSLAEVQKDKDQLDVRRPGE